MSAQDHLQPKQLKMFMTPNEIHAEYTSAEVYKTISADKLWAGKLEESKHHGGAAIGGGVIESRYDSIKREGVHSPVELVSQHTAMGHHNQAAPRIIEGHHRIAAQNDLDPNKLMPVLHHATPAARRAEAVGQAYRGWV